MRNFGMKSCPFSSENRCDTCNLFSEREEKCAILLIGENLGSVLNINFNVGGEKKSKRPNPPEHRETPPVISKPLMSPAELEMIYKR